MPPPGRPVWPAPPGPRRPGPHRHRTAPGPPPRPQQPARARLAGARRGRAAEAAGPEAAGEAALATRATRSTAAGAEPPTGGGTGRGEGPGVCRADRREGVGGRPGEGGDDGGADDVPAGAGRQDRAEGHGDGRSEAEHEDQRAQPGHPARRATQQHRGPPRRGRDGDGEGDAGDHLVAPPPQDRAPDADEGADGRRQGDRVVRVDDPLAQAEHGGGDEEPAAPQHGCGAGAVRPLGSPGQHQQGDQQDQRGRQQPRGLTAELGVEHAGPSGRAPASPALPATAADAARLVARHPAEAVVAEDQVG